MYNFFSCEKKMGAQLTDVLLFECPHCRMPFEVRREDVRCGIFRHAVFKSTLQPIPPHASRTECESLVRADRVYGCAKPMRICNNRMVACDYI